MVNEPILRQLKLPLPGNNEIVFLRLPPGRAMLGSPRSEVGRDDSEAQHQYVQNEGCMMSRTEVTQGQFEAVMGTQPSYFRADGRDRPVEQIRYTDVADYTAQSPNSFLGKTKRVAPQKPATGNGRPACPAKTNGVCLSRRRLHSVLTITPSSRRQ